MIILELPIDLLKLILKPFQNGPESMLVSMTCKKFYSVIERKRYLCIYDIVNHYIEIGSLPAIELLWYS